jgi:hypothetical protein
MDRERIEELKQDIEEHVKERKQLLEKARDHQNTLRRREYVMKARMHRESAKGKMDFIKKEMERRDL